MEAMKPVRLSSNLRKVDLAAEKSLRGVCIRASRKGTASAVPQLIERRRALAAEGIFYQRTSELWGWEKRTSAAKAGCRSVNYGTAEAVPFQNRFHTGRSNSSTDRVSPQTLTRLSTTKGRPAGTE